MDGAGADVMVGGPGADVFVLVQDGARDRIEDAQTGRDGIDLTAFGPGLGAEDLSISARGVVRFGDETRVVRSDGDGGPEPSDLLFA